MPHHKVLYKLKQLGIDGQVHQWIANWLSNRQQRVVIDGFNSERAPVTSGVPQGSVLGPVLFIIYINDLDVGLSNRISIFANDTKIGNSFTLTKTGKTSMRICIKFSLVGWKMPFNVDKCQFLQVGTRNKKFDYEKRGVKLKSVQCAKDLGSKSRQTSNSHSNASMQQIKRTKCWASLKETFYSRIKM